MKTPEEREADEIRKASTYADTMMRLEAVGQAMGAAVINMANETDTAFVLVVVDPNAPASFNAIVMGSNLLGEGQERLLRDYLALCERARRSGVDAVRVERTVDTRGGKS